MLTSQIDCNFKKTPNDRKVKIYLGLLTNLVKKKWEKAYSKNMDKNC
jgi:hypothetical protein